MAGPVIARRAVLVGGMAAALPVHGARRGWDAVVSRSGRRGTVPSVEAALHLARAAAGRPFRVLVERGTYREKLTLDVPGLHLAGEGAESIIAFGAAAGHLAPDGKPWGTGRSATVTVTAPGVTLSDLTIRNSFDYLGNRRTGAMNGAQAVALALGDGADGTVVRRCALEGYQDTFYLRGGRARVNDCTISGCVDFIFGGAAALFERCEIRSRTVPGSAVQGFVAAPSTPADQAVGLVFRDCRLTREADMPDGVVFLGRPWRAGGNMALTGSAVFLQCWMDAHIARAGWTSMGYRGPDGVQRQLQPEEARLFEYQSRGPGAGPASVTRRFLAAEDVVAFTRDWDRA